MLINGVVKVGGIMRSLPALVSIEGWKACELQIAVTTALDPDERLIRGMSQLTAFIFEGDPAYLNCFERLKVGRSLSLEVPDLELNGSRGRGTASAVIFIGKSSRATLVPSRWPKVALAAS